MRAARNRLIEPRRRAEACRNMRHHRSEGASMRCAYFLALAVCGRTRGIQGNAERYGAIYRMGIPAVAGCRSGL